MLQDNAIGSIVGKSANIMDPINDRKAVLGFQQDRSRHLLDLATKVTHPMHTPCIFLLYPWSSARI